MSKRVTIFLLAINMIVLTLSSPLERVDSDLEAAESREDAKYDVIGAEKEPEWPHAKKADDSSNEEKIKTIAFNSHEFRLIGPNQKEVEMKDDVSTKMMIAMDNIGKDLADIWGRISKEAEKGWQGLSSSAEKGWQGIKQVVDNM